MIEAIIFDWVGTLFERFKSPYLFSEKVLKKLKKKYKLGLVTLAGQGIEKREKEIKESYEELGLEISKLEKEEKKFRELKEQGIS